MSNELIKLIETESNERRANLPEFGAGDAINVHVRIKEGAKERVQQFQGTVIDRLAFRWGCLSTTIDIHCFPFGLIEPHHPARLRVRHP